MIDPSYNDAGLPGGTPHQPKAPRISAPITEIAESAEAFISPKSGEEVSEEKLSQELQDASRESSHGNSTLDAMDK